MMANLKIKNNNSGFTLIETFVAITILMIAILGPMSIIAKFFSDSAYAKNQIASSFLAQDGMETVINLIRNNTEIRRDEIGNGVVCEGTSDWLNGIEACKGGCNVDSLKGTLTPCSDSENGCMVNKDNATEFYNDDSANPETIYRRFIKIDHPSEITTLVSEGVIDYSTLRRSAQVTSFVWWLEKGVPKGPVVVSSLVVQNQCP